LGARCDGVLRVRDSRLASIERRPALGFMTVCQERLRQRRRTLPTGRGVVRGATRRDVTWAEPAPWQGRASRIQQFQELPCSGQRHAPCNLSPRLGTPPTGSRSLIPCIGGSTRGPRKQGALRCSGGRCDKAHSNNYGTLSCLFPRHAGVRASSTSRLRPAATIAATNSGRCAIIVR